MTCSHRKTQLTGTASVPAAALPRAPPSFLPFLVKLPSSRLPFLTKLSSLLPGRSADFDSGIGRALGLGCAESCCCGGGSDRAAVVARRSGTDCAIVPAKPLADSDRSLPEVDAAAAAEEEAAAAEEEEAAVAAAEEAVAAAEEEEEAAGKAVEEEEPEEVLQG